MRMPGGRLLCAGLTWHDIENDDLRNFYISPLHNVAQAPVGIVAPVHRTRVQLQDDTMIRNHTFGVARSANASTGVTRLHVRNGMKELYQDVRIRAAWFPSRLLPQLVGAIIQISRK